VESDASRGSAGGLCKQSTRTRCARPFELVPGIAVVQIPHRCRKHYNVPDDRLHVRRNFFHGRDGIEDVAQIISVPKKHNNRRVSPNVQCRAEIEWRPCIGGICLSQVRRALRNQTITGMNTNHEPRLTPSLFFLVLKTLSTAGITLLTCLAAVDITLTCSFGELMFCIKRAWKSRSRVSPRDRTQPGYRRWTRPFFSPHGGEFWQPEADLPSPEARWGRPNGAKSKTSKAPGNEGDVSIAVLKLATHRDVVGPH